MTTRLLTAGIALVVGTFGSAAGSFAQTGASGLQRSAQPFGNVQPGRGGVGTGLQRGQTGRFGAQQNALGGRRQAGLQNRNQQGFVGSDAQDTQAFFRNMSRGQQRRQMFNFALESLNELRESRRSQQQSQREQGPVRIQLRPTFLAAASPSSVSGNGLQERLAKALPNRLPSTTEVTLDGGTATIRGVVASDYDRALVEKMLSLQPGVRQVDNRLTIEQPAEQLRLEPSP